ncbi:MAG: aminotransferase class III-fold pyridoxal phosphate-dependent enzyme [Chloroflexi bacterium]|nr:aminotransferase class III-fold pyridoxal phosphate-dependent enzyme [Chloroflexota bacterium]MBP8059704.1 aminotransferase class III-fold pyridoxal phosphate-dependent enzyme [Chloroflexota bacterium]
MIAERGEGAYLYATDGTRYLDFTCGIGVTNTGHCHPHVVQAIQAQAGKLLHGQANIVYHPAMLSLIEELRQIVPPHIDGFFFSNSGAEAVEGSVKLARMATGRPNVIVFQGSFHGRTVGTMSLTTSKTIYRSGYQPLMAGVYVAPFPYAYRLGMSEEQASSYALEQLRYLLLSQTAPQETAAILIEPVLGEGGYVVPPASFLRGLRQICDEHGILLIFDEVQSGFGRTGKWFALEHSGVLPDIMTVAKGLASGMPLSGVFAPMALMQKWTPGSHGGTYGGNALACAAATATIQAIRHDNMLTNAQERGQQLMSGLRHLQEEYPSIGDVRGVGLMIATEFTASNGQPDKNTAKAVVKACFDQGLMLLTCGTYDNIVRWIPPLVVSSAQVNDAVGVFAAALQQVSEQ